MMLINIFKRQIQAQFISQFIGNIADCFKAQTFVDIHIKDVTY
jgi:hypothetical protein